MKQAAVYECLKYTAAAAAAAAAAASAPTGGNKSTGSHTLNKGHFFNSSQAPTNKGYNKTKLKFYVGLYCDTI